MTEAVSFKKKAYVGDKLLDLWNCVADRMHNRTDENGNRLPASPEEVKKKGRKNFASRARGTGPLTVPPLALRRSSHTPTPPTICISSS
jgi:hypothetical protein